MVPQTIKSYNVVRGQSKDGITLHNYQTKSTNYLSKFMLQLLWLMVWYGMDVLVSKTIRVVAHKNGILYNIHLLNHLLQ